jgi:hypothetical protein
MSNMESQKLARARYLGYSGPLLRPVKKTREPPPSRPISPPIEPAVLPEPHEDNVPKSNKNIELILIGCGMILLLVNLAGTWISFSAANAAKDGANEANRLTRQLLRGTSDAHIVTKVVSQDIRRDNRQIRIGFLNDGKVNALEVQGSATVCLLSFPSQEKLACKTIPFSRSQLRFGGDEINLGFDGIVGDGDITLLENNRATVQYSATYRFNDGFDDWVDGSSCQLYFVRHFLISDGVQERNWASCDVGKAILLTEFKRRAEQ